MDVIFISPGYPTEMPEFVRGLSMVGARVWGVGDQTAGALPQLARRHLSGYLQVPNLFDEDDVVQRVRRWVGRRHVDRVEVLGDDKAGQLAHIHLPNQDQALAANIAERLSGYAVGHRIHFAA